MSINVKVHGLSLKYDSYSVLKGLDFEVLPGQCLGLLGANGAGKSTLLRCINNLLKPTEGCVLLEQKPIAKMSPRYIAQKIAVVPQKSHIDFDFTVEEAILMGRLPYLKRFQKEGIEDKEMVQRAMSMTGVSNLAKRSIITLSGGEAQRVIIARALCQNPKILLLDEPTASLDLGYQHSLLGLIKKLNIDQGITVIAAIHDLNLAAQYFDQMLLLSQGKILAAGMAEKVLSPKNIKEAYNVDTFVYRNPLLGSLQVSVCSEPVPLNNNKKVHVIGGGEEAIPVMDYLRLNGYSISVGPVTPEDSSYRYADFYRLPVIKIPPFSPISGNKYRAHMEMLEESVLTIIPPIPFGEGNLSNLKAVEQAMDKGINVAIIEGFDKERDFTEGKAEQMISRLKGQGALSIKSKSELLVIIKNKVKA